MSKNSKKILLTGATGYVGGRLLPLLEKTGHEIRCIARKPDYLKSRVEDDTDVVKGDFLDSESLGGAFKDIDVAFYLVHLMAAKDSFEDKEKQAAENFAKAAKEAGVKRIVYLGGLGDDSEVELSPHLRSRHKTGDILRESGVQVIEFRSSVVIGSGSLSFEMIRSLVEKLPVMTTPTWVYVKTQPIAISDLLSFLINSVELEFDESKIFEIGGKNIVSYGDLMKEYANQRGLKRYIIPVPVLTPRISSLWLGLVTPVYAIVGKRLIDSLRSPTTVKDYSYKEFFDVEPLSVSESIAKALDQEEKEFYGNRWSDSLASGDTYKTWGGATFGTRIVDSRKIEVYVNQKKAFAPIRKIGGKNGWYYTNWLWKIRAYIDLLVGGVGIRRARRHPEELKVGDVLDWWRVEEYIENEYLRLIAEMKVPGRAWLEFNVERKDGKSIIHQTATFDPLGLSGRLYWYGLYPVHAMIFSGMLKEIARKAES